MIVAQRGNKKCRAKFLPDLVLLFIERRQVSVTERSEAKIERIGNKLLSKSLKVELMQADEKRKTEMASACVAR